MKRPPKQKPGVVKSAPSPMRDTRGFIPMYGGGRRRAIRGSE